MRENRVSILINKHYNHDLDTKRSQLDAVLLLVDPGNTVLWLVGNGWQKENCTLHSAMSSPQLVGHFNRLWLNLCPDMSKTNKIINIHGVECWKKKGAFQRLYWSDLTFSRSFQTSDPSHVHLWSSPYLPLPRQLKIIGRRLFPSHSNVFLSFLGMKICFTWSCGCLRIEDGRN